MKPLSENDLYEIYELEFENVTPILGGVMKGGDLLRKWIEKEEERTLEKEEEKTTTFMRDEKGLYLECRQWKAAFREAFTCLNPVGITANIRQQMQHALHIEPNRVYPTRNGQPIGKEEGTFEWTRPPKKYNETSSIKRADYISADARMRFQVRLIRPLSKGKANWLDEDLVRRAAHLISIGAVRTQEYGKLKLVSFEKVS